MIAIRVICGLKRPRVWADGSLAYRASMPGGRPPAHLHNPRSVPQIPPVFPPFGYYLDEHQVIGPRRNYAITDVLIDSWRPSLDRHMGAGRGAGPNS